MLLCNQRPIKNPPSEMPRGTSELIPIVGIGFSSDSLHALKQLLAALPPNTGFAFVCVPCLESDHPGILAQILSHETTMLVLEASDGLFVNANHVYVIPAALILANGVLCRAQRSLTAGLQMPIDHFFSSLADHSGSEAVGVVLSGVGSDGSAGVRAIHAIGGFTLAQDVATRFPAMPHAALDADCVDCVLSPEGIAAELARIAPLPNCEPRPGLLPDLSHADEAAQFASIFAIVLEATSINLSFYREQSVRRRILRRMALHNLASLEAYADLLRQDPTELAALHGDLLIRVTRFFRDPDTFAALNHSILPALFRARPFGKTLRIWSAGCATGEEAFSLAILFQEYMTENGTSFPLQVFASDLSVAAIETARAARYPDTIAEDVSPERLKRFFTKTEEGYRVNQELRKTCFFVPHNLISDPPFLNLDLVCCRNVLIYLGSVQQEILRTFNHALLPSGILLLGPSEATPPDSLFTLHDHQPGFYQPRGVVPKPLHFYARSLQRESFSVVADGAGAPLSVSVPTPSDQVDRILLNRYNPAGVVIDADLQIVEIRGDAARYLALQSGAVTLRFARLIPDVGLFLEVELLLRKARLTGESARREGFYSERDGTFLNLEAIPLDSTKHLVLVLFEPAEPPPVEVLQSASSPTAVSFHAHRVVRLKKQLEDLRLRLLQALEENQLSLEKSQVSTEDALSSREELLSFNVELETAKEELQFSNQELLSVNHELRVKNTSMQLARDVAVAVVETIPRPLVVLEPDLRIRTANRLFCQQLQLSQMDLAGQLIYSLSLGSWNIPGLRTALDSLLLGATSFPEFEVEQDFPGLGHRTLRIGGGRVMLSNMIVLSVDDVTQARVARQLLREAEDRLRQSQKMEALGRLAGGVAHEFNNLLTVILSSSGLLQESLPADDTAQLPLSQIGQAAETAASLTQQLLSFSRQQVIHPEVLLLNSILADSDVMLRRLMGERITVVAKYAPDLWSTIADAGEILRAVVNLCLNARDAMPDGGILTLETTNLTFEDPASPGHLLAPGPYVTLTVRDTGTGIEAETLTRIFEPFFTTKEVGKGSGIGLAAVRGVVEQCGGEIRCLSKPGEGSSFIVQLPAVATPVKLPSVLLAATTATGGLQSILLVEDQDMVRKVTAAILLKYGYVVHQASNAAEGLVFVETHQGPLDLLISDVVMPGLGGRIFAERAVVLRPDLRVLFVSGHTEDILLKEGIKTGLPFLQKPYTPAVLAKKVRETLHCEPALLV